MKKCRKKVPLAHNGNDRGVCDRSTGHGGFCANGTCYRCSITLTKINSPATVAKQRSGECRKCAKERQRKSRNCKPINYQVPGNEHTFPCGCTGVLPEHRRESNRFAVSSNGRWSCRIQRILLGISRSAKARGYKPINSNLGHAAIRKLMDNPVCVICKDTQNPLDWKLGPGTTPHLHHDHDTGEAIGFSHRICNQHPLENRVLELENRVRELEAEVALLKAA